MSKNILHEKMFSMDDIAHAASIVSKEFRGIQKGEFLRLFVSAMREATSPNIRYTKPSQTYDRYAMNYSSTFEYEMEVRDFWKDIEYELFKEKPTFNDNSKRADTVLHIKGVIDAGMYGEGDDTFFVLFTKNGDLEFDTWEATERHLNKIATKVRWVTENERPLLSMLKWQDDDDDEYLPDVISTTLPLGSTGVVNGITAGLIPPYTSGSHILRKIPKP